MKLQAILQIAAAAQLTVATLNLFLVPMLKWREPLEKMPLLMREVIYVHAWFVSIILAIFAVLTLRFAPEMAAGTNAALTWLAAAIGIFWAIRTVIQVAWYSPSHWRGIIGRTAIHITLFLLCGTMAATYLVAAIKGDHQ